MELLVDCRWISGAGRVHNPHRVPVLGVGKGKTLLLFLLQEKGNPCVQFQVGEHIPEQQVAGRVQQAVQGKGC